MSTQGIISIVKDDKVLFKCVAGCNGMTAKETSKEISDLDDLSLESIYEVCAENNFGCDECLVVQNENDHISSYSGEELDVLYKEKFHDSKFNPRWKYGTAAHTEIIHK